MLKKGFMEWRRMRKKEDGQGMKFIEKTRWEGGKKVIVERVRIMEKNETQKGRLKRNKIGKTRKNTRWKR